MALHEGNQVQANQGPQSKSPMKKAKQRRTVECLPSPHQTTSSCFKQGQQTNVKKQAPVISPPRITRCTEISSISSSSSKQTKTSHSMSQQGNKGFSSSSSSSSSIVCGDAVKNVSGPLRKRKHQEQEQTEMSCAGDDIKIASTVSISTKDNVDNDKNTAAAGQQDHQQQVQIKSIVCEHLWSHNSKDVATAMASLCKLVAPDKQGTSYQNRTTAFRLGAPLAIVQAMRFYIHVPEIQRDACFALAGLSLCKNKNLLSYDVSAGQTIIDTGGLQRCLQALQHHMEWATVQAAGCCFINNLCLYSPTAVRKLVYAHGGLLAVLQAMEHHKHHGHVQNIGCRAIHSMLLCPLPLQEEAASWVKASVELRGIEIVIAAMFHHTQDAELQFFGCKFLLTLLTSNTTSMTSTSTPTAPPPATVVVEQQQQVMYYMQRIVLAKGIVAIAQAHRIHNKNIRVCRVAQNVIRTMNVTYQLELSKNSTTSTASK